MARPRSTERHIGGVGHADREASVLGAVSRVGTALVESVPEVLQGSLGNVSGRPVMVNRGRWVVAFCACACLFAACSSGGSGASKRSPGRAVTTSGAPNTTSTTTEVRRGGGWATYFGDNAREWCRV